MLHLGYSVTPEISDLLTQIETNRRSILLTTIQPRKERELRWNAMIDRVALCQSPDTPLGKNEITTILLKEIRQSLSDVPRLILNYRNTLVYLHEEWLASPKPITLETVITLADMLNDKIKRNASKTYPINAIEQLLEYTQMQKDHPLVSAAIILSQWSLLGNLSYTSAMANIMAYLFLFKYGYDFRNLLVIEGLHQSPRRFAATIRQIQDGGSSNDWIAFAIETWNARLGKTLDECTGEGPITNGWRDISKLTDRQQEILSLIDNPQKRITNKEVQKRFSISQITASRDLSQLAAHGLLYAHEKGRSTYYTII